jgi:hypothetical protein
MFAMIVDSAMPIVSMSWSRKRCCTSSKSRNDASSITPSTCSSNRTGITMMLRGGASPSPEPMWM